MTPQPKPYSLPINLLFDGYDYELISKAAKLNDGEDNFEDINDNEHWPNGDEPEYYESLY